MRKLALVLWMVVAATGCVRKAGPVVRPEPTFLEVDNRRFNDMAIYAVNGSRRVRIGTATGNVTSKMRIPANVVSSVGEVQFLADPIGGSRTGVSERIFVRPGDTVKLTILP
jgi:hypothetical protein